MSDRPAERRDKILTWLKNEKLIRIDELASRLAVSMMTVHRDLGQLAQQGLVEKVHGGAQLPDPHSVTVEVCTLCRMPIQKRLQFMLTTKGNEQLCVCCAHCGLLLLEQRDDIEAALLREFIYGRIINARQAYFVVGSRISLCCEPSVLAFSSQEDGADFQRGFGGRLMDFAGARRQITSDHSIC